MMLRQKQTLAPKIKLNQTLRSWLPILQSGLDELKETLKDENASKEQIDAKVKTLSESSHKLAEAMYKKDGAAGEQANGGKKKDDDVIDAEVE